MSRIKIKVNKLLEKSRDSALLAVEIYNKPRTAFRSINHITMIDSAMGPPIFSASSSMGD